MKGQIFPAYLCNYARTVWPRTTTFSKVTCGDGRTTVLPRPMPRGGSQRPLNFLEPSPMYAIRTWERGVFQGVSHALSQIDGTPALLKLLNPLLLPIRFCIQRPNSAWRHTWEVACFLPVRNASNPRGRHPKVRKIFGTPTFTHTIWLLESPLAGAGAYRSTLYTKR